MFLQNLYLLLKLFHDFVASLLSWRKFYAMSWTRCNVDHFLKLGMFESLNWLGSWTSVTIQHSGVVPYLVCLNKPFNGCLLEIFIVVRNWFVFSGCGLEMLVHSSLAKEFISKRFSSILRIFWQHRIKIVGLGPLPIDTLLYPCEYIHIGHVRFNILNGRKPYACA